MIIAIHTCCNRFAEVGYRAAPSYADSTHVHKDPACLEYMQAVYATQ